MKKLSATILLSLFAFLSASSQNPCLPEGIEFTSQEKIDNFQTNYPGCTEIEGDVLVKGDDINNLEGLNSITSVGGDLKIGHGNPALTSLSGLESLTSIGGWLNILGNWNLTSLTGLNTLTTIEGDFDLGYNPALTSFAGLESLELFGGDLIIYENEALTSLSGVENISSIGGDLYIYGNEALTSLSGLDNVIAVTGDLRIGSPIGPGYFGNPNLISLTGLNALTTIGGDLYIHWNDALTSLSGVENISSIGGDLYIESNDALTSLSGLENLTSIGGYLYIDGNPALISLYGLENLTSIGAYLYIEHNDALTKLSGLDKITAESIIGIAIRYNDELSYCSVQSICDHLASPNGYASVENNAPGCNSPEEVEEACEEVGITDNIQYPEFSIYPNPATKEVIISTNNDVIIKEVNIYNQVGQRLIHEKLSTNMIDVSSLKQGMYVIEVITSDMKVKEKLIIKY